MSLSSVLHSDSENDDANDESATKPLLLQSTSPKKCSTTAASATTIKLPSSANGQQTKIDHDNRVLFKFTTKLNRCEYRRSHRDKWSRINIGILTISFLSVVYFCVSMNLNVDKPSPQIIVDVPPVDTNLLGPKGKFTMHCSIHFFLFFSFR